MPSFPIVLLPSQLQAAKIYHLSSSELAYPETPQEPSKTQLLAKPGHPPQAPALDRNTLNTFCTISFFIAAFLGAISRGVLLIVGLALIAWFWINTEVEISNYERRKQEWEKHKRAHEDEQTRLQESMDSSAARKQQYKNECKAYEQKVEEIRRNRILQALKATVPHDGTEWSPSGRSEPEFLKVLEKYFPDKIHRRLALSIPNCKLTYRPDFAYVDEASGLRIDIEVDEPYAIHRRKKLTHYVGDDDRRNTFFLERGWIVLRFSEEQVVLHPRSCCKAIAEVVSDLLGDELMMKRFADFTTLTPQPQWTKEEANEMWFNQTREQYKSAQPIG